MLETAEIGVPCPKCGHKTTKTIAWIKAHDDFACSGCGATIAVEANELVAGIQKAEQSLAKLRKSLGQFGKRR
ncbi:hypothetical protein [Sinorhizobium meliloti]|uniref:hypothetical protein n=1 Tax=Rhizobium meliloti TaxID=382 RepID=UPI0018E85082|nr:hypothetical protein [Sinorhizobium meliloti]QQF02875.1 hypothetical protein JFX10_16345 [Sinorhizobium meliloti]